MRYFTFSIKIILITFIIFGCFETAFAQETQKPAKAAGQGPWVSIKAVRQMKLEIQSITNDIKNGANYLKERAKEKVRQEGKGMREQFKEGLKDYGHSFSTQIKWGIDKVKQGGLRIKDFLLSYFKN